MHTNNGRSSPVAVIGAGPYGLATAAHLRERGVELRVFGDVMGSWSTRMPVGMFLKSTPWASSIAAPRAGHTLADFSVAHGDKPLVGHEPVPVEQFIRYGRWFQSQLVPDVEDTTVARVDGTAGRFELTLSTGERVAARAVVLASGFADYAYTPPELAGLASASAGPSELLSHSGQLHDLSVFAGRRVSVVGAGQSALETAALLHELGVDVRVIARAPRVIFGERPARIDRQRGSLLAPESTLGPAWSLWALANCGSQFHWLPQAKRLQLVAEVLGPAGAWWLRERVDGAIPVDVGTTVRAARADAGEVVLDLVSASGERQLRVDHVIAATGYEVSVDLLSFLAPELRGALRRVGGWPRLNGSFESTVRGMYFVGLSAAAAYGPVMRFVCGTRFPARRVSAAVAA
jgi:FAD-dependent urate hydroxylase